VAHPNDKKLTGAFLVILVDDLPISAQNHERFRDEIQFGRANDLIANGKWKGQKK
jgi:hypothetical protein